MYIVQKATMVSTCLERNISILFGLVIGQIIHKSWSESYFYDIGVVFIGLV